MCVILAPRGHFAMSGDLFGCHCREGAASIYWVEAAPMAPIRKSYPASNVDGAQVENLE